MFQFSYAISENYRTNAEVYLLLPSLSLTVWDYSVPIWLFHVKIGEVCPVFFSTQYGILSVFIIF